MAAPGRVGSLLVPALRWDAAAQRYACEGASLERTIQLGVGGYCFFGGRADAARALAAEIQARSAHPLLFASDLERGAGQQFEGATQLPPLAALGSLDDADVMRRAGELTSREARGIGVNWVLAPVVDLDVEPENPIVGTRAIGADPARVAQLAAAWIEGCHAGGALACAKHFPGHGRTTADSHAELPVVSASRDELMGADVAPYRAAVGAGVAAVMSAHVAFPAFDPTGAPATLSRPILRALLRRELGFEGLVVTDALIMEGVRGDGDAAAAVRALDAGCDLLLYPSDVDGAYDAITRALEAGTLSAEHVRQSVERRDAAVARANAMPTAPAGGEDLEWATAVRQRVIHVLRGAVPDVREGCALLVVDDDVGGPYPPPSRAPFVDTLRSAGVPCVDASDDVHHPGRGPLVVLLFGEVRAWKGRPGYSAGALARVTAALEASRGERRDAVVVQFGHPRLAASVDAANMVCAWGGEAGMQRAAAEWLVRREG